MTTTGESLFSGLLNRRDIVGEWGRRSDLVQFSVKIGPTLHVLRTVPVKDFRFDKWVLDSTPPGTPLKFFLTFYRNSLFSPGTVVQLKFKWPHTFDFRRDRWFCDFRTLVPGSSLRATLSVLSPGLGSALKPPLPRVLKMKVPKGTIQHIADISFAYAALALKAKPRRLSSTKLPFPLRLKKPSSPLVVNGSYIFGSEQTGVPWTQSTHTYQAYNRSYSSVNTPGFGKLKKVNLPINPYSLLIVKVNLGQGLHFRRRRSDGLFFNKADSSLGIIDGIPADPSFDSSLDGRAIQKLIRNAEVDINNIAQDLVQFRQTTNMIATSAFRIASSITALKHGNFNKAIHSLHNSTRQVYRKRPDHSRDLASNWLELQYGWKPLLQDIDGSMRSLANFMQAHNMVRTVRASAQVEIKSKWPYRYATQPNEPGGPGAPFPILGYADRVSFQSIRYVCRFALDNSAKALLSQTGFTSPVNLAWELLPYSFVVDWFLPIGPYLESLSAFEGYRFVDGAKTTFARNKDFAQLAFDGQLWSTPSYDSKVRALYDREVVSVNRVKLLTFPRNHFSELKNPFSTTHALNAVALLKTAFK